MWLSSVGKEAVSKCEANGSTYQTRAQQRAFCSTQLLRSRFLLYSRTAGAAPLLAWNRMLPAQSQYPPGQYQGLGGPMNYPQRPEDRMDRGRQVWKCCVHLCGCRVGLPLPPVVCWLCHQCKHRQINLPTLPSPSVCACGTRPTPSLRFIKTRSSVLPSHTPLAA